MEGRAAARPDVACGNRVVLTIPLQWRAGQLPGLTKPVSFCAAAAAAPLQWRAGQLPGLT